jgi:hypothetical protein
MAPKHNSPVKTAGIFEPGQISFDVTVTSPVYLPTLCCAKPKIWIKVRNGGGDRRCDAAYSFEDGVILSACKYV